MKKDMKKEKGKKERIIALALAQKDLEKVEGGHIPIFPNDTCTGNDCD